MGEGRREPRRPCLTAAGPWEEAVRVWPVEYLRVYEEGRCVCTVCATDLLATV